jgi:hypothetical protein
MRIFSFPSQVNEPAARLVATGVVASLTAAWALHLPWLVPLVALGFVLRVGWGPRFSLLARGAMALAAALFPKKPVAGAPKRFAQGIGAACTVAATALFATGHAAAGWYIVAMIVGFATLEAALAFCMGCWLYRQLQRTGVFPDDVCVDCAPSRS